MPTRILARLGQSKVAQWTSFILFGVLLVKIAPSTHSNEQIFTEVFITEILLGIFIYKSMGKKGLFFALLLPMFFAAIHYSLQPFQTLINLWLLTGLIPMLLLLLLRLNTNKSSIRIQLRRHDPMILFTLFLLGTTADLSYFLYKSEVLTQGKPRHDLYLDAKSKFSHKLNIPERHLFAFEASLRDKQVVRNVGLLSNKSYVYSPVRYPDKLNSQADPSIESIKNNERWATFFVTKSYYSLFDLVSNNLVAEEIFRLEQSLVTLKPKAIKSNHASIAGFLKTAPTESLSQLLKTQVFISSKDHNEDLKGLFDNSAEPSPTDELKMPQTPSEIRIKNFSPNKLELEVLSATDSVLYWADSFDKYWSAQVNGNAQPVYKANLNFKALPVRAGTSEVRLVYNPKPFVFALYLFYGLFAICLTGGLILWVYNRRPSSQQAQQQ